MKIENFDRCTSDSGFRPVVGSVSRRVVDVVEKMVGEVIRYCVISCCLCGAGFIGSGVGIEGCRSGRPTIPHYYLVVVETFSRSLPLLSHVDNSRALRWWAACPW